MTVTRPVDARPDDQKMTTKIFVSQANQPMDQESLEDPKNWWNIWPTKKPNQPTNGK
jgi:hypothetical protein